MERRKKRQKKTKMDISLKFHSRRGAVRSVWYSHVYSNGPCFTVFAIDHILFGWKTYTYHYEIDEPPIPNPTQPKKKKVKGGIWATFFPQQIVFRGLGLILDRKQTTINPTQPDALQQWHRKRMNELIFLRGEIWWLGIGGRWFDGLIVDVWCLGLRRQRYSWPSEMWDHF